MRLHRIALLEAPLKASNHLGLRVDQLHRSRVPDIQGLDSFLSIGGADHLHLSSALLAHCVEALAENPLEHQAATIRRYFTEKDPETSRETRNSPQARTKRKLTRTFLTPLSNASYGKKPKYKTVSCSRVPSV